MNISSVDILSDHFYPADVDKLSQGVELVGTADKVYFAAEYGWTPSSLTKSMLEQFFGYIEKQQNKTKPIVSGGEVTEKVRDVLVAANSCS